MGKSWAKAGEVKQQVDYSDVLFRQIDRIAELAARPGGLNINQFAIGVDILAAQVSFLKKINFVANPQDTYIKKYKSCIAALEAAIKVLDDRGLIFKYRIKGHFGGDDKKP